jgi:dTDP-4-amino-4,6-dideoxygalactose transaminase
MINVTKPYLPPLDEIIPSLEEIWRSGVITNNGPFVRKLEEALQTYLDIEHLSLVNNGTTGLMLALKASEINGEVITTPYSFAATSNVLSWSNLTPCFVDVSKDTLNINPAEIESAINDRTGAILAVHCYGNPCETEAIEGISKKYGIPVIYDACHAFGVRHNGRSLLENGDYSVVSLHATKVFNTFEGGIVVSGTAAKKKKIDDLKNFGFESEISIKQLGINGKMAEINAAIGLAQLNHMPKILMKRCEIDSLYRHKFNNRKDIVCLPQLANQTRNYPYFPVLITPQSKLSRDEIVDGMRLNGINVRRYFYPLISEFLSYKQYLLSTRERCPNAYEASLSVICLPIYPDLTLNEQSKVIDVLCGLLD